MNEDDPQTASWAEFYAATLERLPAGYDWYPRPSIAEEGEIDAVALKAGRQYQIRALLTAGVLVAVVSRSLRDAIQVYRNDGPQSTFRTTSMARWEVMPSSHDREAELWFGFKADTKSDERFEYVIVEEIPEGGATMGRPPVALWRWPAMPQ